MKAQATVFMIIGLVVLFIAAIALYAYDRYSYEPDVPLIEKTMISRLATSCIEEIASSGARVIAAQGGYLLPTLFESADGLAISYGHYAGDVTLATITEMENDLGMYIDSLATECIKSGLPRAIVDNSDTKVIIGEEIIMLETHCRVEQDSEVEDVFKTEIRVPLGKMHTLATEVVQHVDSDWIDLSTLALMPVHVNLIPQGESILYYMLDSSGLLFNFAVQYIENKAPVLDLPDMIKVNDGQVWMYKVNCTDPENDELTVSDSTVMIDTLPDGSVLSTLEVPGNYPVIFTCEDSHNNIAEKTVLIIVE